MDQDNVAGRVDYPVLDKIGLSARYDFDLEFTPDETVFGGAVGKGPDDSAKPGFFRRNNGPKAESVARMWWWP